MEKNPTNLSRMLEGHFQVWFHYILFFPLRLFISPGLLLYLNIIIKRCTHSILAPVESPKIYILSWTPPPCFWELNADLLSTVSVVGRPFLWSSVRLPAAPLTHWLWHPVIKRSIIYQNALMEGQTQQILSHEIQVLRVITSWLYLLIGKAARTGRYDLQYC